MKDVGPWHRGGGGKSGDSDRTDVGGGPIQADLVSERGGVESHPIETVGWNAEGDVGSPTEGGGYGGAVRSAGTTPVIPEKIQVVGKFELIVVAHARVEVSP